MFQKFFWALAAVNGLQVAEMGWNLRVLSEPMGVSLIALGLMGTVFFIGCVCWDFRKTLAEQRLKEYRPFSSDIWSQWQKNVLEKLTFLATEVVKIERTRPCDIESIDIARKRFSTMFAEAKRAGFIKEEVTWKHFFNEAEKSFSGA